MIPPCSGLKPTSSTLGSWAGVPGDWVCRRIFSAGISASTRPRTARFCSISFECVAYSLNNCPMAKATREGVGKQARIVSEPKSAHDFIGRENRQEPLGEALDQLLHPRVRKESRRGSGRPAASPVQAGPPPVPVPVGPACRSAACCMRSDAWRFPGCRRCEACGGCAERGAPGPARRVLIDAPRDVRVAGPLPAAMRKSHSASPHLACTVLRLLVRCGAFSFWTLSIKSFRAGSLVGPSPCPLAFPFPPSLPPARIRRASRLRGWTLCP